MLIGTAITVLGLAGCGQESPTAGSGVMSNAPAQHSAGQNDLHAKAIVDGHELTINGGTCSLGESGSVSFVTYGPNHQFANANISNDVDSHTLKVIDVQISTGDMSVTFNQGGTGVGIQTNAEVSKGGDTYTITGNAWQVGTQSSRPFEFTATCS